MEITFKIVDFKSISHVTFSLRRGLNILVGPNGAGKTCLFAALKFPRDLLHYGAARAVARAGGPKRVLRRGSSQFSISISTSYGKRTFRRRQQPYSVAWSMSVAPSGPDGVPALVAESLEITSPENPVPVFSFRARLRSDGRISVVSRLASADVFGRDLFSVWQYQYAKRRKDAIEKAFNAQLRDLAKRVPRTADRSFLPFLAPLDDHLAQLSETLRRLNEYNIAPDLARRPTEPMPLPIMESDGEGVAEVIYALENKLFPQLIAASEQRVPEILGLPFLIGRHGEIVARYGRYYAVRSSYRYPRRHRLRYPAVLEAALPNIVQELAAGVQPLDGITTDIDPTTGKRFVVFCAGRERFYPEEVSDGTVKWLCLLTSIFVPSSTAYLLEEPENFLHPWMQQRLVDTMRQQAHKTQTVFVLTSHSATVLNSSHPNEIFVVSPTAEGTKISQIPNRKEVEDLLRSSSFGLGDLWVSGALSGVPTSAD